MSAINILLVDDSADFRTFVTNTLGSGYTITEAKSEARYRELYRPYTYDLVILDMRLETEREGLQILREIHAYDELQPVIMVSNYGDTDAVHDSTVDGNALLFLHKRDLTTDLLARMVETALQQTPNRRHLAALQMRMATRNPFTLPSSDQFVRRVEAKIRKAANEPESIVLICGENGSGHLQVAQEIHRQSQSRATEPFVTGTSYTATSEDIDKTLYGAPTIDNRSPRRKGLFEQANGGVFFLNGMEAIAPGLRDKIGQTLRTFMINDCTPPIPLNFQFVAGTLPKAATELSDALQKNGASERLIEIHLPPLRDRREDIPMLAEFYLRAFYQDGRTSVRTIARDALDVLESNSWPCNLTELQNAVEYAAIQAMAAGTDELTSEHLSTNLTDAHLDNRNYRYHAARAEVLLVDNALKNKLIDNNTQLAKLLGYTDRFTVGRRIRKALTDHKELATEFPRVLAWFPPPKGKAA